MTRRHGWSGATQTAVCSAAASFSRTLPGQRHGPRVLPESAQQLALGPWRRGLEDLVPVMEAQVDHQRIEVKSFEHLHLQIRVADVLDHFLRCLFRLIVPALLGPGVSDEVDVVRPVHERVHTGRAGALDEALSAAAAFTFVLAASS